MVEGQPKKMSLNEQREFVQTIATKLVDLQENDVTLSNSINNSQKRRKFLKERINENKSLRVNLKLEKKALVQADCEN